MPFPEKSPIILPGPLVEPGAFQSNLGGGGDRVTYYGLNDIL